MSNYYFVTYRFTKNLSDPPIYESQIQSEHPLVTAAKFASEGQSERIVFYRPLTTEELNSSQEVNDYFQHAVNANYGELFVPDAYQNPELLTPQDKQAKQKRKAK